MNDEIQQLRQRIQQLDQSLQDGAISAETTAAPAASWNKAWWPT
jgi:cell division septum initiation protein DivIVA